MKKKYEDSVTKSRWSSGGMETAILQVILVLILILGGLQLVLTKSGDIVDSARKLFGLALANKGQAPTCETIAHGISVCPGRMVARVATSPDSVFSYRKKGEPVAYFASELTTNNDAGIVAASLIILTDEDSESSSARTAKLLKKPCIARAEVFVDHVQKLVRTKTRSVCEGDMIYVDASLGLITLGGFSDERE